jgi:hypothetical protein
MTSSRGAVEAALPSQTFLRRWVTALAVQKERTKISGFSRCWNESLPQALKREASPAVVNVRLNRLRIKSNLIRL